MNPLIIYLQPTNGLDEVDEQLKLIPCDILKLKYFPYPDVYKIATKTIECHAEYDYIIWLQNDIVLTFEAFKNLCAGIMNPHIDILGAVMNVDLSPDGLELLAYSIEPFKLMIGIKTPFVNKDDYRGLKRCFHNGGVFICSRKFYLDNPLTGMGKAGYNADYEHGKKIWNKGIDYFVDNEICLKHLRYQGTMQVGIKKPEVEFVKR